MKLPERDVTYIVLSVYLGKKERVFYSTSRPLKELMHRSHSFTCKLHHACLSFVSVHQMAPPLTEAAYIQ